MARFKRNIIWAVSALCVMPYAYAQESTEPELAMPVDVSAETLTYDRKANKAYFEGRVAISRGQMVLLADRVDVFLATENADNQDIEKILARGHVTLSQGVATAKGKEAIYNPKDNTVVLTGNVEMERNGSTLTGDHLTYDLKSGAMNMSAKGTSDGRVRASFTLNKKDD